MTDKINFAWPVTSESAIVYNHFVNTVLLIKSRLLSKQIIIFGAGIRGCCLMKILQANGLNNIIFCDNNIEKQGHLINQYNIISLKHALAISTDKVFLISPENSQALREQLLAENLTKNIDFFSFDISIYDKYVEEYTRPVNKYLLVMGDCAFSHIALTDSDTISLGDMIKARLGENNCKVLAMHGLGQQAQYHILNSVLAKGERPYSVVMLVLEALTPKAHIMPRTQHPKLIKSLLPFANQNEALAAYADLAQERYDKFQVETFAASPKNEQSEKLFMQMNYLFRLRESTEGVYYLKKTIQLLNLQNIPFTLYIPPVNYEQGEKFFGQDFKQQYFANFEKLFMLLAKDGLRYNVVDASYILTKQEFSSENTVDETANFAGRKKLLDYLFTQDFFT